MKTARIVPMFLLAICLPLLLQADDSAASVALGGIQLKREARISMKKERLFISQKLVRVEFEFLNTSPEDITTEVAFPIPEYELDLWSAGGMRPFDDFRVWVEGKELRYSVEAKAFYRDKDVSAVLKQFKVDIPSFAHCDEKRDTKGFSRLTCPDFERLSADAKKQLRALELFSDDEAPLARWKVRKYYHWNQKFPAGTAVHIKHEYTPGVGFEPIQPRALDSKFRKKDIAEAEARLKASKSPEEDRIALQDAIDFDAGINNSCVDTGLQLAVSKAFEARKQLPQFDGYLEYIWVDYILTTANSWKTPIEDFELIVEKSERPDAKEFVSFCWDGPVQKLDATHFVARTKDFVPKRELHIAFFEVQ